MRAVINPALDPTASLRPAATPPRSTAPSVDILAGVACVFTGPTGCIPAATMAFGHSTTMTLAEGVATDWCDPGHLLAQEAVNSALAWGATLELGIEALAPDIPAYIERMLQAGNAGLQALLDYAQATP
jgi:hypothetical protein